MSWSVMPSIGATAYTGRHCSVRCPSRPQCVRVAIGSLRARSETDRGEEKSGVGVEIEEKERRKEESDGNWGQRVHSLPVVRSFRAFWRFWMAVLTSSYCRALPAYLQYFCALAKSSAES